MENDWKEVKLGDISTMKFGKKPKKSEGVYKGYPFFSGHKVVGSNEKYLHTEPELVVVARGAAGTGDVKISPPKSFITNASIVVKLNEDIADKKFYYYYLQTRNLRSISSGAKKPRITITNLKKCKVKIPPLLEQKKIGSILSTFDRKIKRNNETSETLEEAGQAIFRHWFMEFEFPNEDDKPYKSNGGEFTNTKWGSMPEGWSVGKYTDIVDVVCGATPKKTTKEFWDGNMPLFTPRDVENTPYVSKTEKHITKLGLSKSNGKLYPSDTVFVTAKGTVGKVNISAVPMAANQACCALMGREDVGQYFVYMLTKNCEAKLLKRSQGIVFNTIDIETFDSLNIVIPPKFVIEKFQKTVTPLFTKMKQLSITNNALSKLRDKLLPKLISGEMRVV